MKQCGADPLIGIERSAQELAIRIPLKVSTSAGCLAAAAQSVSFHALRSLNIQIHFSQIPWTRPTGPSRTCGVWNVMKHAEPQGAVLRACARMTFAGIGH